MNPLSLLKLKPAVKAFKENHPKFFPFVKTAMKVADKDSVVEVKITTSEGKTYVTNFKVTDEDMQLLDEVKNIIRS